MAAITPLIYTWEAQNTAGDTKRKCTSAVVLVGMCTGNVITKIVTLYLCDTKHRCIRSLALSSTLLHRLQSIAPA